MSPKTPPAVRTIAGVPTDATRPARTTEGTFATPSALFVASGVLAVVDQAGVWQRASPGTYAALPVGETGAGEPLGQVRSITRREAGVLLATDTGLFHDAAGRLLRSPLSAELTALQVRFVDSVGSGASETLWLTGAEASRVAGGHRETITLADPDEPGALQAVIGRGLEQALLVRGASLYQVDLAAQEASVLARGLGHVSAFDVGADGVVVLATDDGLLEVAPDGGVTRRTLTAEGAPAATVVDVAAAGDAVLITTSTQVLELRAGTASVLTRLTAPRAEALVRDGAGDSWVLDGVDLVRLATGSGGGPTGPSFATEVKPFLRAHCTSCHTSGADYAPVFDLESYAVARAWADALVRRLTSTDAPMPPARIETLTPAQYDVVVRWVDGGLKP